MLERKNSTQDAGKTNEPFKFSSTHFEIDVDDVGLASAAALAQLNKLKTKYREIRNPDETKTAIANDLMQAAQLMPRQHAMSMLIDASQHEIFENSPALEIILGCIRKENHYLKSPILAGEHTLAFIKEYMSAHPEDVDQFLANPELILMWINLASTAEISKLIQYFFHIESKYYVNIRQQADAESDKNYPYKAVLCAALMSHGNPTEHGIASIKQAVTNIFTTERSEPYMRTVKSLRFRIHPTMSNLTYALGCYINASKLDFSKQIFTDASLHGIRFYRAVLNHSQFKNADLTAAVFSQASLQHADFSNAKLISAVMRNADMSACSLHKADLTDTDFSCANLTGANLQLANFRSAKFADASLDNVEIIDANCFNTHWLPKELDRLHDMIKDHPQQADLCLAIARHLIRHTRANISDKNSAELLDIARKHPIFSRHDELHYLKSGINTAVDTYNKFYSIAYTTLFKSAPAPQNDWQQYETKAQKLLNREYEILTDNVVKSPSHRPPPPDRAPPAPPRF